MEAMGERFFFLFCVCAGGLFSNMFEEAALEGGAPTALPTPRLPLLLGPSWGIHSTRERRVAVEGARVCGERGLCASAHGTGFVSQG
jgi:hypothetical protein